jgi:hypothetical protein
LHSNGHCRAWQTELFGGTRETTGVGNA